MKKTLAIILILALVTPLMIGCGKKEEDTGPVTIRGKAPSINSGDQATARGNQAKDAQ
ncbi:MAG TPA: hypothetical protein VNI20_12195 [Fimbriimonadaceae bacterium]|nr:hypothetical protein [Fimbriimonadaceae bacterium]